MHILWSLGSSLPRCSLIEAVRLSAVTWTRSPSLAISIPCPRATSPGRSYCVHLLCVFLTCFNPFRTRALDYSVAPPSGLFSLARYLAFLRFPSCGPERFIRGPLFLRLWPCESTCPRANTVFLQGQSVSFEEAPSSTSSRDWIETFCCAGHILSFR